MERLLPIGLVVTAIACFNSPPLARDGTSMIMLAGDVMTGRGIDQILRQSVDPVIYEGYMRSAGGYVELAERTSGPIPRKAPPAYIWGDALTVLKAQKPEVRIINLETSVTTHDKPWPGKGIQYRMHPGNVDVLTAAEIDCAVLANNHVIDWNREGLLETVETIRSAGVKTAGAGADIVDASAPAVLEVHDGRVLIFAMAHDSSGVPTSWAALPARSGVHLLADLSTGTAKRIAERISSTPQKPGDRIVVSIHWGGNWGYDVPAEQRRFAKVLIDDGGVDVVHGHSSHHPKGIEIYGGRLIIYGAGDLINDYEGIGGYEEFRSDLSLIYLPRLAKSGELQSMAMAPMRMDRFRLNRATAEEAEWLRRRLSEHSRGARFEMIAGGLIELHPK